MHTELLSKIKETRRGYTSRDVTDHENPTKCYDTLPFTRNLIANIDIIVMNEPQSY
jgi:hypothetical protein